MKKFLAITAALVILPACVTAKLNPAGEKVEVVMQWSRTDCTNLGPIFGKGGGEFGGAWISDEQLMEFASNDLRNKAAIKGATHVVTQGHQMGTSGGQYGTHTSTATQQGIAYKCPVAIKS